MFPSNPLPIFVNSNPQAFKKHAKQVLDTVKEKTPEHRIIFLKSWNEWAEGNYMEPDLKFGRGYIDALKQALEAKYQRMLGADILT